MPESCCGSLFKKLKNIANQKSGFCATYVRKTQSSGVHKLFSKKRKECRVQIEKRKKNRRKVTK